MPCAHGCTAATDRVRQRQRHPVLGERDDHRAVDGRATRFDVRGTLRTSADWQNNLVGAEPELPVHAIPAGQRARSDRAAARLHGRERPGADSRRRAARRPRDRRGRPSTRNRSLLSRTPWTAPDSTPQPCRCRSSAGRAPCRVRSATVCSPTSRSSPGSVTRRSRRRRRRCGCRRPRPPRSSRRCTGRDCA